MASLCDDPPKSSSAALLAVDIPEIGAGGTAEGVVGMAAG